MYVMIIMRRFYTGSLTRSDRVFTATEKAQELQKKTHTGL